MRAGESKSRGRSTKKQYIGSGEKKWVAFAKWKGEKEIKIRIRKRHGGRRIGRASSSVSGRKRRGGPRFWHPAEPPNCLGSPWPSWILSGARVGALAGLGEARSWPWTLEGSLPREASAACLARLRSTHLREILREILRPRPSIDPRWTSNVIYHTARNDIFVFRRPLIIYPLRGTR